MDIIEAPVANQSDGYGKSYPTQQAKDAASMKVLSEVAAKYDGTDQGELARYMLAGFQAANGKYTEAEKNFKQVASSGTQTAALANVGLAQLYAGQGRNDQAKAILQNLVAKPSPLVSKEQATVLLANLVKSTDAKRAKQLLDSVKPSPQRPALERAIEQLNNPTPTR
jgi:TolA-binding protein